MTGEELRDELAAAGMTAGDLYRHLGIAKPTVYSWLRPGRNVPRSRVAHVRRAIQLGGLAPMEEKSVAEALRSASTQSLLAELARRIPA